MLHDTKTKRIRGKQSIFTQEKLVVLLVEMFSKFKNAIYNIAGPNGNDKIVLDHHGNGSLEYNRSHLTRSTSFRGRLSDNNTTINNQSNNPEVREPSGRCPTDDKGLKFRYSRPEFLQLKTDDEILVSADQQIRPIILPRDTSKLPWKCGYAEVINAGKSERNEDQAVYFRAEIKAFVTLGDVAIKLADMIPWTLRGRRHPALVDYVIRQGGKEIPHDYQLEAIKNQRRLKKEARVTRSISMIETFSKPYQNQVIHEERNNDQIKVDQTRTTDGNSLTEANECSNGDTPSTNGTVDDTNNSKNHLATNQSNEKALIDTSINNNNLETISEPLSIKSFSSNSDTNPIQYADEPFFTADPTLLEVELSEQTNIEPKSCNARATDTISSSELHTIQTNNTNNTMVIEENSSEEGKIIKMAKETKLSSKSTEQTLPWVYFGVFDGHAGSAVAVAASNTLHKIIAERLQCVADLLISLTFEQEATPCEESEAPQNEDCRVIFDKTNINSSESVNGCRMNSLDHSRLSQNNNLSSENLSLRAICDSYITVDSLIKGALESSFWTMDELICHDKRQYKMPGGCTALVALFILGKLYVSNAGDSRAIVYKNKKLVPMSYDFTPNSERERIRKLGLQCPEFLGNDFTHLEFIRRPERRDLGKQMLYKDAYMTGWSYKTITTDDLKFPLIYGEGKRSRVLATIGVTRGFGDHELRAQSSSVFIKPFLSPEPEVKILPLEEDDSLTDDDVLIMATDGCKYKYYLC